MFKRKVKTTQPLPQATLAKAFCDTDYFVLLDGRWQKLAVGASAPKAVQSWLAKHNLHPTAWQITAHNPNAQQLQRRKNARRHKSLRAWLDEHRYPYLHADSRAQDGSWPPEQGFCVLNMDKKAARTLGRHFGQKAIVAIPTHGPIELIWL